MTLKDRWDEEGCHCPEIRLGQRWLPYCEGEDVIVPEDREPLQLRCPECQRGLVRFSDLVPSDPIVEEACGLPFTDVTYRCLGCGWVNFISVPETA